LAQDLMAGRIRNEVAEALEGKHGAVLDQFADRLIERKYNGHDCTPAHDGFD
jgi:hypothetical protein